MLLHSFKLAFDIIITIRGWCLCYQNCVLSFITKHKP